MILLSIVGLLITYILRTVYVSSPFSKFPLVAISFLYWYPFYHFGVFVSMFQEEVGRWLCKIKSSILYLIPFLFLLTLIEGFFWSYQGLTWIGASQIKASSFALSLLIFLLLLSRQNKTSFIDTKVMAWLGKGSYVIYLSHMFALARVKGLLSKIGFIFQMQPVFILLATSITLALCACLVFLIEKPPFRKIKKYIGI